MWNALTLPGELNRFLAAGAAVGLIGVGVFGLVHAVIIVPIWGSLLGGVPFGVGGGLMMGWAFSELRAAGRWEATVRGGLTFGLLMWVMLVPMTAFGAILRATGVHGTDDAWEIVVECLLAFGMGALTGRLIGRRWRSAIAVGSASLGLALAMGGPIPVTNSVRATQLFAAFAAVYALCGLTLVLLASAVDRQLRSPA
jgi:hypothetical protein